MEIKTLEKTTIGEIASTFNEAFEGYFVPLVFTEESMATKIKSEGIQLHYSIGAFDNGKLVGFILHGYDEINGTKTIYNAGTGVIASHRGRRLTETMYHFAIPMLSKEGFHTHLLEVIENNFSAKHVYEKLGFRTIRKLRAFRGKPDVLSNSSYIIQSLEAIPEQAILFSDMMSAWQNSLASVARDQQAHDLIGAYINDELVGFAAYVAATGRIKQLAVHPAQRRKGIGSALLRFIQRTSKSEQLVATNVDEGYEPAVAFLKARGFEGFLGLYEMKLETGKNY